MASRRRPGQLRRPGRSGRASRPGRRAPGISAADGAADAARGAAAGADAGGHREAPGPFGLGKINGVFHKWFMNGS